MRGDSPVKPARVLVIDDSEEITGALTLLFSLKWPDAEVIWTHRGKEGIELVRKKNPDLVVLDKNLPDISGLSTLCSIKSASEVPVLVLSAWDNAADIIQMLDNGATAYLVKPFDPEEFLSQIQRILNERHSIHDPSYLHLSCKVNATHGLTDLLSQAELSSLFEVMIEDMKIRGYEKCESAEINVRVLANDLAVASNMVLRYDNEEKLEQLGAVYALRKTDAGWRYTMVIVHGPIQLQ